MGWMEMKKKVFISFSSLCYYYYEFHKLIHNTNSIHINALRNNHNNFCKQKKFFSLRTF